MPGQPACTAASYGTDEAAALNAVLKGGNIHLIVDGHFSLSTSLIVYGNTTITVLQGCGFIMRPLVNQAMMKNANFNSPNVSAGSGPGYGPGYLLSNIVDTNILVEGGIWNANSLNSTTDSSHMGKWTMGFSFLGVSGLTIRDIQEMWDTPTYAFMMSNVTNVWVLRNFIANPGPNSNEPTKHTDGIHFVGPANNLWVSDDHLITGDDAVALNANDGFEPHKSPFRWGPITDAFVTNISVDHCNSGVRLQSSSSLIDRVHIAHISGGVYNESLELMHEMLPYGDGNYGMIDVEDFNVRRLRNPLSIPNADIDISGNTESLSLSNIEIDHPTVEKWPIIKVHDHPVQMMSINGMRVLNPSGNNALQRIVDTASQINNLTTDGLDWIDAADGSGSFFGGATVPANWAMGSYVGPNRLLEGGYHPKIRQPVRSDSR